MDAPLRYSRPINRLSRIKEIAVSRLLKVAGVDFGRTKTMVSIIGDHISDSIRAEGLYERRYLEAIKGLILEPAQCSNMVAIDVGANIGNHTLFLADQFSEVIAFEPNPLARSLLQINLELNGVENVQVLPVGLSERTGRSTLVYDDANLGAARQSEEATVGEVGRSSQVELVVGDDVIDRSAPVGFIKVDVEGAEESALKGLELTIQAHKPVIMIEQLSDVIDGRTGTSPAFSYLQQRGYEAMEVRRGSAFRRAVEGLSSVIAGRVSYEMQQVSRLQKRDYYCLLFVPRS